MDNFQIQPYIASYREQILAVWEKSVLATHNFLSLGDFKEIKKLVSNINFSDFQVFCLIDKDKVLGFIGISGNKVEILFVDPSYFRQGFGYRLLNFVVIKFNANEIDVNEQNIKALKFYEKFGFQRYDRSEKDNQGRNYPILKMRLANYI
ncbi:GNAT family N-acetyltransferase [Candidatus Nitrosacidococcus sp. I8]|uniref:GNAT family N-acetyltransferase n=1 Tax=Candidatus Nitrosacidococcus sp. I8 TaxID=2942908 RepID=UPI0022273D51|nr:GNAT family N-acetyltransferase [Candidatus Nitrosacidococcus sp. I8]CAH9018022.1 Peptidyl-lysine N-acetyltransferase YjaB [Candidatus Nitrosacidococcus sp. I8]